MQTARSHTTGIAMAERLHGRSDGRTKAPPVRVLLVDDEEAGVRTRRLVSSMRDLRCTLDCVGDYDEALGDMRAGGHDVYLLNCTIGGRTGVELLHEANAEHFRAAAILLADKDERFAEADAMEAGALDCVSKEGLGAEQLERSMRYALYHKQREDALEEELAVQAAELARAEAALKLADKRKDEFLGILAHELRNPLTAIRNAVHLLRRSPDKDELAVSATGVLERQLGQMVRLVEDLFDVSRISRGAVELRRERVELAPVVEHAASAAKAKADAKGHALDTSLPSGRLYVKADPARLAQVLGHLLDNACKFTPRGGRISIAAEREGGQAVIRVKDSGRGLTRAQATGIFDKFVQANGSLERATGGLGIGLTLVKELVEMQDGTLDAKSAGEGRGSEFVVRLPLVAGNEEAPAAAPPPAEVSPVAARRILIVDDNRDAAKSLSMLLDLFGNETHLAHDGIEAVAAASRVRPDVVLLDIGLPGMDGYDAARAIRGEDWGKPILLLALTGWDNEDVGEKSREAGFDGHLVKPVDLDALMRLLAKSGEKTRAGD